MRIAGGPHDGATVPLRCEVPPPSIELRLATTDALWSIGGFHGSKRRAVVRYWLTFLAGDGTYVYGPAPARDRARMMELAGTQDLAAPTSTGDIRWYPRSKWRQQDGLAL